jgi:hypothetical protein
MSALVVLSLAAVFVFPWFVPAGSLPVVSDSQAVGFSNRTAMLGLVAACLAVAGLARLGQRSGAVAGTEALLLGRRAEPGSRVSGRLVAASMILTTGMVLLFGTLHGERLIGDSAYHMNALLRVLAGGSPYAQIEFTYGPLLLYLPLLSVKALGKLGVAPHVVYYGWVAIASVLGLLVLVFILNRTRFRAGLRNQVFVFCVLCGALSPALVLATTPLRFLLPYALFVACLDDAWGTANRWHRRLSAVLAVAFTFALSPEMGVALLVALLAAASPALMDGSRPRELLGLGGLLALGAVAAVFLLLPRATTFGAFAGGAFYLPVLPGLPALAFVGTMLVVSYVTGSLADSAPHADKARHLGWFALALVLVVPAFGRADFGHLLGNGMGAFILCAAMVDQRWGRGVAYIRAVGFVFVSAVLIAASVLLLWIKQRAPSPPVSPATAKQLASYRGLGYTAYLGGDLGVRLAQSGGLAPLYVNPAGAINDVQFKKAVGQLEAATALAIPMADYDRYLKSAASGPAAADGIVFAVPADVGDPVISGLLHGFPVRLPARHPVFDPAASFGAVLKSGWRVARLLPGYLVLEKRP